MSIGLAVRVWKKLVNFKKTEREHKSERKQSTDTMGISAEGFICVENEIGTKPGLSY